MEDEIKNENKMIIEAVRKPFEQAIVISFMIGLLLVSVIFAAFRSCGTQEIDYQKGQIIFIKNEGFLDGNEYVSAKIIEVEKDSLLVSIEDIKKIAGVDYYVKVKK